MPVTRSILRPVTGGIVGASVGLGGGAAASTLLDDLVSWWSLDEASGSRADSHGSNTLTDSNTVTQATGKVSTAGQFTKVNSEHLTVPATHGLHGGDRDIAIVLWVYLDSDTTEGLVRCGTGGVAASHDYILFHVGGATKRFEWDVAEGSSFNVLHSDNFGNTALATWYFVVCEYNASTNTSSIQVNNGTADTLGSITSPNLIGNEFDLGRYHSSWHDGRLDEVAFWSRLLTADEKTELYNSGLGIAYPG